MEAKLINLPLAFEDQLSLYKVYKVYPSTIVGCYKLTDDRGKVINVGVLNFSTELDGGTKYDDDKLRWDLNTWLATEAAVGVLTFGAKKYSPNGWRMVEPYRYEAALHRHLAAHRAGEKLDSDSGLPHLAHAACCLNFLLEMELGDD